MELHYPSVQQSRTAPRYALTVPFTFYTPVTGYTARMPNVYLYPDGLLVVAIGYRWDLGTYAIDDPAMVVASLAHDPLCELVAAGLLPYETRADADRYFREVLQKYSVSNMGRSWAWVRWAGVVGYRRVRRLFRR
jgi:hypothetical protein